MVNESKARKAANKLLSNMENYHPFIPIADIDAILVSVGLQETEPAIYCGREGSCNIKVGEKSYLSLTWYKMESGNYEIVSYVC